MDDFAIKVENVSKLFKLPHEKNSSIKSAAVNFYRREKGYELQHALKNVSFEVKTGEFFGIVGRNGSGKSTLLKLLAGIYSPTQGEVYVRGSLTPFIELGVGFNPELTGRENVFLNGALLGFSRKEMMAMYKDIVKFAELEKFMDQKLKNYSSGMQVRLAFSIAIRAHSDILLVDEVLAVGDSTFQQKCFDYFRILKKEKRTVVFVSHDKGSIESFCDRALLIETGELKKIGRTGEVLSAYNDLLIEQSADEKGDSKKTKQRWGNRDIYITSAKFYNGSEEKDHYNPGDQITVVVNMKANKKVQNQIYGLMIKRKDEEEPVFTTNTKLEHIKVKSVKDGDKISVEYKIDNIFGNGTYSISPAIANENGTLFYDWRERMADFSISGWDDTFISIHPNHQINIKED